MSNENHQLFTTEQIRQRLEEGGESARWLAQAVVSYYRPAAPAPSLFSFSTKLDEEAQGWLITSCRSANNIMPITIFLPAFIASFFYSA
jgi:hypothetical protein